MPSQDPEGDGNGGGGRRATEVHHCGGGRGRLCRRRRCCPRSALPRIGTSSRRRSPLTRSPRCLGSEHELAPRYGRRPFLIEAALRYQTDLLSSETDGRTDGRTHGPDFFRSYTSRERERALGYIRGNECMRDVQFSIKLHYASDPPLLKDSCPLWNPCRSLELG